MPILNYTTKVDAKKTVAEIQEKLAGAGATRIIIDYDGAGNPAAVSFSVNWNGEMVFFRLPVQADNVLNAMLKSPSIRSGLCTLEQAYRVAWRIIKDWVEAQLAIVEADQAKLQQVFLPYAITKHGDTLYDRVQEDKSPLMIG